MKRAKGIIASLRLIDSLIQTQSAPARSLHTQVTQHLHLSPFFSSSLHNQSYYKCNSTNAHKKFYSSSTPNSLVELVTTNEWSEELEQELDKSHIIKHESVVYVLKKLDKTPQRASNFFNWVTNTKEFKPSSTVYALMLRILGNKGTIKEFWDVAVKMPEEGFDVDEETYVTIFSSLKNSKLMWDAAEWKGFYKKMTAENDTNASVKAVIDVVIGSDWNDDVKKRLREVKVAFSENTILKIYVALRKYPLTALRFFRWLEEDFGYTHGAVSYNSILRVLAQEESIKEFWSIVKEMKSAGHDVDIDTYIKITRWFHKIKMMKDAVELYELLMDSTYKPSAMNCSSLLKYISLSNNPDLNLVYRVVAKYEATGHTLSKADYDGIHRSLTSVGNFDEAEKIVITMRKAGYEPDNITYSQVVFGLCKAGRLEEACKVLDEMEAQGCVPDIKTWTILIQGHCNKGEINQALKCFADMLGKNVEADADLFEILVNGLFSNGMVDSAYTLLTEMVNNTNLRPWQHTYKKLIEKLLGERKLEEAINLVRLMRRHKYPPYPEPFVDFISKYGSVNDAKEFLSGLSTKEYPSSSAYLRVLGSFCNQGRQSEARDLLYNCPHHIRNHASILKLFS